MTAHMHVYVYMSKNKERRSALRERRECKEFTRARMVDGVYAIARGCAFACVSACGRGADLFVPSGAAFDV